MEVSLNIVIRLAAWWFFMGGTVSASPLEQLSPGPWATAHWDWDFGVTQTSHPLSGAPLWVDHYGRLTYPSDGSGGALPPVSSDGPFPLVVFGHGRFQSGPTLWKNHLETGYLMDRLASWGIVATSVNLDVVGSWGSPAGIPQRGDIILSTIARTLDVDAQPGEPPRGLEQAIDATRMALLGHSRGGEGVVSAALKNLESLSPYPILAVGYVASTDFEEYALREVPLMALYGSKDGDVGNGWPIEVHDRATSSEKIFEYIHGANHFWFTENITYSGEGDADISRDLHHAICMGYLAGFAYRKLVDPGLGSQVFCDGDEMAPLTRRAEIHPMYRHPRRVSVDDFERNFSLERASSGAEVVIDGFTGIREISLIGNTFYHRTRGFEGDWSTPSFSRWMVRGDVPVDISPFSCFSVKFAQRESSRLNTPGKPQDVWVGMADAEKNVARVRLSDYGTIPWPETHSGSRFPKKTVLRTTRIPLAEFVAANPALDLTRIQYAGWGPGLTDSGQVEFDDLEFTR